MVGLTLSTDEARIRLGLLPASGFQRPSHFFEKLRRRLRIREIGLFHRTGVLAWGLSHSPELGTISNDTKTVDARFVSPRAAKHLVPPYGGLIVSHSWP